MSIELTVRPRGDGGARAERCPYCHDALDEARASDDEVRCEGCGTSHHLACIVELGRCTVMGCERPLAATGLAVAAPERGSARSRAWRGVQERVRAKARAFVLAHCRSATTELAELPGLLALTLQQAARAQDQGDWAAAAELWGEVARIETIAPPDALAGVAGRVGAERARELAEDMEARDRSSLSSTEIASRSLSSSDLRSLMRSRGAGDWHKSRDCAMSPAPPVPIARSDVR